MMKFGEYARGLRLRMNLTLRLFCRLAKVDSVYWSKVEQGISPAPEDEALLKKIAWLLATNDEARFLQRAARSREEPPKEPTEAEIAAKLPAFVPPSTDLDKVVDMVTDSLTHKEKPLK